MEQLLPIITEGGPFAMAAIFAFLWWQERTERKEGQQSERQTLREVLPAIDALDRALRALETRK